MTLLWTLFFTGILGLMHFALTLWVIVRRAQTGTDLGDGGDAQMLRRIRAQGNFVETVPMALLMLAILDWCGLWGSAIIALGTGLVLGRALHAASILTNNASWSRRGGMVLTLLVLSAEAALCLVFFVREMTR